VIGVNQRDLRDFSMHPEIFSQLIKQIPEDVVKIAESGIESRADAINAYCLGYNAVLVGTALSKLDDPKDFFS
jgi:indole-3-glycerol phosphate synthase